MGLRQLTHNDAVLFDTKEQLEEYIQLSGDKDIFPEEINGKFPRIQSKYWSFNCCLNNGKHFQIKQTALTKLKSYHQFKLDNGIYN